MPERDANTVVDDFARELEGVLSDSDATLVRFQEGHSDRGFAIIKAPRMLRFIAKLSQSDTGFWGLGVAKVPEMLDSPGQFLILLTGADSGYTISPVRLRLLVPKLGTDRQGHDYKIQEGKVRRELRFRSVEELCDQLIAKLAEQEVVTS